MKILIYIVTIIACSKTCHAIDHEGCHTTSDCPDGKWCASHMNGHNFCKDYAGLGAPCNFYTLPQEAGVCDGRIHICYEPMSCMIPDIGGTCVEEVLPSKIGACCNSDDECESGNCGLDEELLIYRLCQKPKVLDANVTNEETPPLIPISNITNETPPPLVPISNVTEEELPPLVPILNVTDEELPPLVPVSNLTEVGTEAFCLVGDIAYENGDTIGHIGYECLDDSDYEAFESICQDGVIVTNEITMTCSEFAPVCHQCGERGMGNALCKDRVDSNSTIPVTTSRLNGNNCMIGSEWASFKNNSMKITNISSHSSSDFEESDLIIPSFQEEMSSSSWELRRMTVLMTVFGSAVVLMFVSQ